MKRWERRALHGCAAAVAISGLAYLWMKYVVTTDDPFALVNHPWQPAMLTLHLLASPPFLLVAGIVFNSHVLRKLRASAVPNRKSGYVSLVTFAVMALSGYLLQVITSDAALRAVIVVHIVSGGTFVISYAIHLIVSVVLARRPAGRPAHEAA